MPDPAPPRVPAPRQRRLFFLTGTRADFGKLKPLILGAIEVPGVEVTVVATGMHLLDLYGYTVLEVRRLPPAVRVLEFENQEPATGLDRVLSRTVGGLSRIFDDELPDLFVVHGDRVEALAGAAIGALRNVPVAHVEGGELSGNIDGVIRHAVSKLSHVHLVANEEAARRVLQLGEAPETVMTIGSPDMDVMLSADLPTLAEVQADYDIPFSEYAVVIYHGVTNEDAVELQAGADALVDALMKIPLPAVVVYPNNDPGCEEILDTYGRLRGDERFRLFPSLRFEAFLTLLQHSRVLIGNSSAGIREAPIYGLPSVNIGSRQRGRHQAPTIHDVEPTAEAIVEGVRRALAMSPAPVSTHFGGGESGRRFSELLASDDIWAIGVEKAFRDVPVSDD